MTDEIIEGPDANAVRRHAKKMLTNSEYRQKYRRIEFYTPHPRQRDFHALAETEVMLRAGNQQGKTHAGAAQMTFDALGAYPDWYTGRRHVKPPIERAHEFLAWCGSTTSVMCRDGIQAKLFGDVSQDGGLGTGLIPLDNIIQKPTMSRGITGFIDSVTLRRETGGSAIIQLKTYEMDRKAWQGSAVDRIWLDELDRSTDEIYGEVLARLTATRGRIFITATPVMGRTEVRKRFIERLPGTAEIRMRMADALHIPTSDHETIRNRYKASERATRLDGEDLAGEGAVFEVPEELIRHKRDPATFPAYWPWMWAVDFSHGGMSASAHPFAAVLGAWDRDNDVIYIVDAIKVARALPIQHVARIKHSPKWHAVVAWPHDGGQHGFESGETFAMTYKRLGLNMLPSHATFKDGGYNFESGISEMESRFATGRLRVAAHLAEWFEEYRSYHRVNGLVNKVDDDLLSATRVLCMDIRRAKTTLLGAPTANIGYGVRRDDGRHNTPEAMAARNEFDLHNPYHLGRSSDAIPRISGESFRYEAPPQQTRTDDWDPFDF